MLVSPEVDFRSVLWLACIRVLSPPTAHLELIGSGLCVPTIAGGVGELVAVAGGEVIEDGGATGA